MNGYEVYALYQNRILYCGPIFETEFSLIFLY
jgi:hypothetical protein